MVFSHSKGAYYKREEIKNRCLSGCFSSAPVLFVSVTGIQKRRASVFEEIRSTILSPEVSHRAAQVFTLPEILPAHTRIVLDVEARLVLLLMLDEREPVPLVRSFQLSSSSVRVFLALLQAYPQYCQYQTLFSALYPVTLGSPTPIWEHYVRPVRRALRYLTPVLQAFGLAVVALRGRGYLLVPCTRVPNLPTTQ